MSRKNVFSYQILPNLTSLSAGFVSNPTVVRNLDNVAYQINVTTTNSVGSFTVEASLDYAINESTNTVTNAGNWITLTLAGGTPTVNAANTNILIDLNQLPFEAVRLRYTSTTAGTGTCNGYVMGRMLG